MASTKPIDNYVAKLIIDTVVQYLSHIKGDVSFVELVNPVTNKPFKPADMWKLIQADLLGKINDLKQYDSEMINPEGDEGKALLIPDFTGNPNDPKSIEKYQNMVHKYITSLHPSKQLFVLNQVQAKIPFLLLDPRRKYKGPINYGYADLLNFVCNPIRSGETLRFLQVYPNTDMTQNVKDPVNPFYNPIYYPIPDTVGNENLMHFYTQNRAFFGQMARRLQLIQHQIYNERLTEKDLVRKLDEILKIYVMIFERENNPVQLSRSMSWGNISNPNRFSNYANYVDPEIRKAQPWNTGRPMDSYRKGHFWDIVRMLTTRAKASPSTMGIRPPENTGIELVLPGSRKNEISGRGRGKKRKSYDSVSTAAATMH